VRRVFGVCLVLSVIVGACGSRSSENECDPGDERVCECLSTCGSYMGCGTCIHAPATFIVNKTVSCNDGVFEPCECGGPIEPECAGADTPHCAGQCSATLRTILDQMPTEGSESECRGAFQALSDCLGGACTMDAVYDCASEVVAMDATCLENPPDTCP
jgi:hypothetical protein